MKVRKRTTSYRYMHGDFDRDGTPNLDDPEPFNKAISKPRSFHRIGYYQTARYTDPEVSMSDELRAIARHNNRRKPLLKKFYKRYGRRAYGRIKTVPSTVRKLRVKYLKRIGDVAAVTVLSKTRRGARRNVASARKKYARIPGRADNFYARPKKRVYYAYHETFRDPDRKDMMIEAQFKSKKMALLAADSHLSYKKGEKMNRFVRIGRNLFRKGY